MRPSQEKRVTQEIEDPNKGYQGFEHLQRSNLRNKAALAARYLDSADPIMRSEALKVIGLFGGKRYLDDVLRLLKDADALVKVEAIQTLVKIGPRAVSSRIAPLLSDREWLVRSYAAWACAEMGAKGYVSRLIERAKTERNKKARAAIYTSLMRLGSRQHLGRLLSLLEDRDYLVRIAAANGLEYVADSTNVAEIAQALKTAKIAEDTIAGKEAITRAYSSVSSRLKSLRSAT